MKMNTLDRFSVYFAFRLSHNPEDFKRKRQRPPGQITGSEDPLNICQIAAVMVMVTVPMVVMIMIMASVLMLVMIMVIMAIMAVTMAAVIKMGMILMIVLMAVTPMMIMIRLRSIPR
jgi:hypothetical protein